MIKLIVSDIDGTLLPDGGHGLNPELFEVIRKLRAQGMQYAAASGRQWVSIERLFDPIKEKIFYLSDNGAYVGLCGEKSLPEHHRAADCAADDKGDSQGGACPLNQRPGCGVSGRAGLLGL